MVRRNKKTRPILIMANYKKQYQELRSQGVSKREAKQYARMVLKGHKTLLSKIEQDFIEKHPEYQDRVIEEVEEVRGYTDFILIDKEPFLEIEWKRTLQHLAFCNIDISKAESSFRKAGNRLNFKRMMNYMNQGDNFLKYGANIYTPVFEELLADPEVAPVTQEDPKPDDAIPEITGGKSPRGKSPRKYSRRYRWVGPPVAGQYEGPIEGQ